MYLLSCNLKKPPQDFSQFTDETDGIGGRIHIASHLQTIGVPQLFGTVTILKNNLKFQNFKISFSFPQSPFCAGPLVLRGVKRHKNRGDVLSCLLHLFNSEKFPCTLHIAELLIDLAEKEVTLNTSGTHTPLKMSGQILKSNVSPSPSPSKSVLLLMLFLLSFLKTC